jgi:hypothetical protein
VIVERLFQAYFEQGRHVGHVEDLVTAAAADVTAAFQNLHALELEPLGDNAVGYRADGVYYLADEQTGQAGGAGRRVQRDR